jgi:hypothetical protein
MKAPKSSSMKPVAIDEAEVKLKSSIVAKLKRAQSARKVTRYLQIDNKIRAVVKYDLAATLPLAAVRREEVSAQHGDFVRLATRSFHTVFDVNDKLHGT